MRWVTCKSIGGGESIAPDLLGVTARRDRAWLTRFIASPKEMRAAGDSTALALRAKYQVQMPNLSLSDDEVAAVIDYVAKQSRAPAPAATATVGPMLTAYLAIQRGLAADSLAGVKARAIDVASEATRGGTVQQLVAAAAKAFERGTDLASARAAF